MQRTASNTRAYATVQRGSLDGRELEATALLNMARQLEACASAGHWESEDSLDQLGNALRRNQKLWTVFQVELERPDHPMPLSIRNNLLQLVRYVDQSTFRLLANPNRRTLESLIRMNIHIAEGLLANTNAPAQDNLAPENSAETSEQVDISF